jgi:hypothetical protein
MLRRQALVSLVSLVLAACGAASATPTGHAVPSELPAGRPARSLDPSPTGQLDSSPDVARPAADLAGFPVPRDAKRLPLPAGSSLLARWKVEPGSGTYRFYRDALPTAGYSITGLAPGDTVASIRFEDRAGGAWQIDIHSDLESALLDLGPEHP